MSLEIRSIRGSFAREVLGAQLWTDIPHADMEKIQAAWADCGVLVFRRQALSEQELVEFSNRFGRAQVVHRKDWVSPEHPEVILVSNLKDVENNHVGMPGTGDVEWHTDQSYVLKPATAAVLYGVEIPNDGSGSTWWANLRLAYDALPAALRAEVEGKRAIYDYNARLAGYHEAARTVTEEQRRQTPPVTHALIQTHPVTGKKTLYMDPTTFIGVEEMAKEASKDLLRRLLEASTRPEFTYEHRWQVGDVVMWDNAFTLHRRDSYDSKKRRFHKRTTVALPADKHIVPVGQYPAAASHPTSEARA
jgi:taurine dioxygenase